jgi:hypothetical protein
MQLEKTVEVELADERRETLSEGERDMWQTLVACRWRFGRFCYCFRLWLLNKETIRLELHFNRKCRRSRIQDLHLFVKTALRRCFDSSLDLASFFLRL